MRSVGRASARSRVGACVVIVALLAVAACTRPAGQVDTAADQAAGGGRAAPATTAPDVSDVQAALARGQFGSLTEVCGPAPAGTTLSATGSQGVTADSVTVGTFSDPNNAARPGVNQELFDVGTVFTAWCNDLGGINGRKINLIKHDAQLFRYQEKMLEACQTDFFLVGGGAVFDQVGQADRLRCMLPDIPGFMASPEARGADLLGSGTALPTNVMMFGLGRYLSAEYPESTQRVGFLTGNLATLQALGNQYEEAAASHGWQTVYDDQYNAIGESTWLPYAQKIANANVRGLVYLGEPENLGLLVQALAQIGYELDWIAATPNMYDPKLLASGGAALDKVPVFVEVATVPFELADRNPALQAYLGLFEKYLPDGRSRALLGIASMSSWLRFAQAAKACGADLTRRCAFDNAQKISAWDAGGLYAANKIDSGAPAQGLCFVPVRAEPDGFVVLPWQENNDFYNCDPGNMVQLKGDYGKGITLADVGKSMADLR